MRKSKLNKYFEYERRKREIERMDLTSEEYQKAIIKLAKELKI